MSKFGIPLSPSSPRHPSQPEVLRRRRKPKLQPVLRAFPSPSASLYPAHFRGYPKAAGR